MQRVIKNMCINLLTFNFVAGYDHSSFLAVRLDNQVVAPNGVVKFPIVKHNIAPKHFGYDEKISFFR